MKIRKAQPSEAPSLTQIANDAKLYWGYPEYWLKHSETDLTITPDFVTANEVYVAEEEGSILGFYALATGQQNAELEQLWVAPANIGTGVGKQLFLHAMDNRISSV